MSIELAKQTAESLNKVVNEYESLLSERDKIEKEISELKEKKERKRLADANKRIEELKNKISGLETFIKSASIKLKEMLKQELENAA